MKRLIVLPVAVIIAVLAVYVVNATARSSQDTGPARIEAGHHAPQLTLAATVADRLADDEAEDADADGDHGMINLFDGAGVPGSFVWNGDSEMSELIEELVSSGDLSAAGADRLREALKHHNIFTIGEPGEGLFGQLDGQPGIGSFFVSPDGDSGALHRFMISGNDDGKRLEVRIEDDGSVVVEGDGYTEEELDEIRSRIEQDHADGKPVLIIGLSGDQPCLSWQGLVDGEDGFTIAIPDLDGNWTDQDGGEFDFKQLNELFPGPHSFSWDGADGTAGPHTFMFRQDDQALREQVERMVREILEEMGIDPDTRSKVSSTSA